ncbi:hypothetical protein BDZ91DRAFT_812367 [Kalaharituber pfeilii]|nr:hypothetical protein BDZ91DRAFT_812367 [Kalaharituber pfeilii]
MAQSTLLLRPGLLGVLPARFLPRKASSEEQLSSIPGHVSKQHLISMMLSNERTKFNKESNLGKHDSLRALQKRRDDANREGEYSNLLEVEAGDEGQAGLRRRTERWIFKPFAVNRAYERMQMRFSATRDRSVADCQRLERQCTGSKTELVQLRKKSEDVRSQIVANIPPAPIAPLTSYPVLAIHTDASTLPPIASTHTLPPRSGLSGNLSIFSPNPHAYTHSTSGKYVAVNLRESSWTQLENPTSVPLGVKTF